MSQSNGVTKLRRIEFSFQGKSYRFTLNPEEYSMTEPNRVAVTQTKGGAFIDDFGEGVKTINFKGTTGFKGTTNDPTQGFDKYVELRDMIRNFYTKIPPGTEITESEEMIFYNYTDKEYWVVVPKTFSLKRSIARPLLYLYEIELICIKKAGESSTTGTPSVGTLPRVEVSGAPGVSGGGTR